MTTQEAKVLISKYNKGECSESEFALLEAWFAQLDETAPELPIEKIEQMGQEIFNNLPRPTASGNNTRLWTIAITTAAATLIALATWLYNPKSHTTVQEETIQNIKPGGNSATLTLSNGQTIPLNKNQKGIVIASNQISYTDGTKIPVADLSAIQSIRTPKGGQYQIELPDGTKVWLNSATIVQYAANLNVEAGKRIFRLVAGEAYFEVSKDKSHPFIVITKDQEVQVLGTQFNISTYATASTIKTTLIEGSIKINSENHAIEKTLVPGQQAINTENQIILIQVDLELETAWKRGKTEFENADLKTVMQMLERWYDIETVYQTSNTESRFTGTVSRSKNISEVLKLMESTGEVHFKIEGRKVIVK